MTIRKMVAGAAIGTLTLLGSAGVASAADYSEVCVTYWDDTTQITAQEADLEYQAALQGQSVEEYCGGLPVEEAPATPTVDTKKKGGMPAWVALMVESLTAKAR